MNREIKVCVIDDEEIVCERLKPMLEKSGFQVLTFTDSKTALQRLATENVDIIITDVKMSPPDGIQILKFVQTHSPHTRVVVITGFATVDTARAAMKGGAVDFIAKPFRLSELRDLVLKIAAVIQDGDPVA